MQRQQLELWSAEPHPTPRLHPQLTARQRSRLVNHLAELMLRLVQANVPSSTPPPPAQPEPHER